MQENISITKSEQKHIKVNKQCLPHYESITNVTKIDE